MTAAQVLTPRAATMVRSKESMMALGGEFSRVFAETVEAVLRQESITRPQDIGALSAPAIAGKCGKNKRSLVGSRGSRGGYPLAALGSEDWCNPSHGGVFSGGRPSVHGVATSPTAPASSRGRRV